MPLLCRIEPKSKSKNFTHSLALPFEQVLETEVIQQILVIERVRYRQTIYTPVVTLWAWLLQVLDADKSLSNGIAESSQALSAAGAPVPSSDTGALSIAHQRLPLAVLQQLLAKTVLASVLNQCIPLTHEALPETVQVRARSSVDVEIGSSRLKCLPCGFHGKAVGKNSISSDLMTQRLKLNNGLGSTPFCWKSSAIS